MQCQKRTDTSPACSLIGRREMERPQHMHREKVKSMKSSIDTRPPAPMPHLTLYGRDYTAKKRATTEAAFSDLKMIQSIARTMTRKQEIDERKGPVSLNADARRHDIHRIMIKKEEHRKRYSPQAMNSARISGEYEGALKKIR